MVLDYNNRTRPQPTFDYLTYHSTNSSFNQQLKFLLSRLFLLYKISSWNHTPNLKSLLHKTIYFVKTPPHNFRDTMYPWGTLRGPYNAEECFRFSVAWKCNIFLFSEIIVLRARKWLAYYCLADKSICVYVFIYFLISRTCCRSRFYFVVLAHFSVPENGYYIRHIGFCW